MNLVALFIWEVEYPESWKTFLGVFEADADAECAIEMHMLKYNYDRPERKKSSRSNYEIEPVIVGELAE